MKKLKYILSVLVLCWLFQTTALAQNTTYTVQHDTCLNKKFSIVFYVIQDSLNSLPNNPAGNPQNYLSTYFLNDIITLLNNTFARICVSFENCKTVIIPNNEYNQWLTGITDSVVMNNWYYPNTINFYIPAPTDPISSPDGASNYVYGSLPSTGALQPKDVIVMQKAGQLAPTPNVLNSNLLHTFGHYFGLEHTYAELSIPLSGNYNNGPSQELSNGSNSQTKGDKISDTNADCYPQGYEPNPPPPAPIPPCAYHYDWGLKDPLGNYYDPPVDNIMSHYFTCRCRFTQEQYNRMAYFILTKRMYLH